MNHEKYNRKHRTQTSKISVYMSTINRILGNKTRKNIKVVKSYANVYYTVWLESWILSPKDESGIQTTEIRYAELRAVRSAIYLETEIFGMNCKYFLLANLSKLREIGANRMSNEQ